MKGADILTQLREVVMMSLHPSVRIPVLWRTDVSVSIPGTSQKTGEGIYAFLVLVRKRVKLSLNLTKHYAKAYGGVDVQIDIFLTSAPVGGEWSASHPCRFTPRERTPCTHWIGGWVGPRADLDGMEKWTFLTLPTLAR
jgi:hypothetical protein